ncbi:MAG: hypothetical protein NVS4B3_12220 [Gemmatimonadaceae bacterium]
MPITIKVVKDGPLQVSGGDVELIDHEGKVLPTKERFSLCRCGGSTNKPFCDGTHSKIGFKGAERAVREGETA